jgi:hypothetical protein
MQCLVARSATTVGDVSLVAVGEAEAEAREHTCADMVQSVGGSGMSRVSVDESNVELKVVRC